MADNNVDQFAGIRSKALGKILDKKREGLKVVGIYCAFCPTELVLAAGALPVGLCGTQEDPIPAAEEVLPRNLCPLIKSSYGFAVTDTCPFFAFSDLIIGETTCDGKKKMFEIMQDLKPLHVMQLPYQNSAFSFDLWVEEIRSLRNRFEKEFRIVISDNDIWRAINLVNREKKLLKEICDLNRAPAPPISGMALLTVTWSSSFTHDREEVLQMLKALKKELEAIEVNPENAQKPRILLTGCPVGLGSEKVIRLVAELGATVVAMENCSGYKTLEQMTVRDNGDPIVALAKKYLNIPCSCMSPNPYRIELLGRMIDDFNAEAVIDLTWQACHTYNIESYEVKKLVKEKKLPFLHLESDYSSSDEESLKVRIEAMLEMIQR